MRGPACAASALLAASALVAACGGTGQLVAVPTETSAIGLPRHGAVPPTPEGPAAINEESTGFSLSIDTPEAGSIVQRSPVRVEGSATGAGLVAVVVAGMEVPVGDDGRFRANLPLPDGAHIITAEAAGRAVEVGFAVDAGGPEFDIVEPARGLFHDPEASGPGVMVRGTVTDIGSGISSLTVDGREVAFDDKGAFSTTVTPTPGLSTIELVAKDGAGHSSSAQRSVVSGRFAPPDSPVDGALDVKLGRDGLEAVINQARAALAATPLDQLVPMGGNGGDFEVTSFNYSGTDVDLSPDFGGFNISVRIRGLSVGVRIEKKIVFVPVTFSGSVAAQEAELRALRCRWATPTSSCTGSATTSTACRVSSRGCCRASCAALRRAPSRTPSTAWSCRACSIPPTSCRRWT